uniref:Uncharacterized protein n=1 Tax=Glossina austeni TaxID=7395 RepID=A0A1A9VT30_GLOAU
MHKRVIRIFQYPLNELTTRSMRCKDSGTCNDASVVKRKLKNIGIYSLDANVSSHHQRYAIARTEVDGVFDTQNITEYTSRLCTKKPKIDIFFQNTIKYCSQPDKYTTQSHL